MTPGRGSLSRGEPRPGTADLLALLASRADDDAAWLLVVRVYLDGLRQYPGAFAERRPCRESAT